MSKKTLYFLLLISILILSACSSRGVKRFISDDSEKRADDRMEQILEALSNKDKDTFKALFSIQSLNEANDFDTNMDYVFDFFQGSIVSWNRDRFTSETLDEYGKKSVMLISWYTVNTDKDNYMFFIIDYAVDTINTDNTGVYTLRVIKAEDEKSQFTYYQDMKIAGIYKPKK